MGANEDELARISAAGPFQVPELAALRNSLAALAVTMKDIAGSPGWEGLSADAAAARLETLSRQYFEIEAYVGDLQSQLDRANEIRSAALADYRALPEAKAPSWVHDTLEAFDFPGLPDPVDLAQGGLSIIEGFLGGQREAAAGRILAAYTEALGETAGRTDDVKTNLNAYTSSMGGDPGHDDDPVDGGGDPDGPGTTGSWTDGGAYRGTGYSGAEFIPAGGYPRPPKNDGGEDDDVEIGVDDPSTGVLPGGGGSGSGGGLGGPGGPGGGLPGGLGTGVGVGTAVAGAGALAAVRLGGGTVGAGAGAARLGTGGLLGAGAPMSGAASAGSSAARAGAPGGARGAGPGLLGAGGAQGGAAGQDRRRKAGRGLGGPIAPRIEDDGDAVLPGDGARAGGRDDTAAASLDG